ncbi:MAG: helix-turn-helix domain-containing protein [Gracilibacteraceae bacterium]|jgi:transcriptional regulator with XRE-family HTH domain|nr:helix-turn-helix domain-containing protein [Gracilibacteraceae bacterium]
MVVNEEKPAKEKRLTIFGKRLHELRGDLSQVEFAKHLGVTAATIGYYENSERLPDAETLRKICMACDCTSDYLIGLSGVRKPDISAQAASNRYGLSEKALEILEQLNEPLDIDSAEQERVIAKHKAHVTAFERVAGHIYDMIKDGLPSDVQVLRDLQACPEPTDEEFEALEEIEQDEICKQALTALNELLTVSAGDDWPYGLHVLVSTYDYCHREYSDVTQATHGKAGRVTYPIEPDAQRNLELYSLNETLMHLRDKLTKKEG